ncbi:response regulator [Brevibacillus choshinensis]|uniref:response regulator n=1 Tax=Brevibacillus choshinensis TaxID=54911 RepID=UPI002E1A89E5|nr:response regulator [Brevibacillus choshinensis]MED4784679.1 response regulator [Brevibacillus choshinensis]
MVRVLIVDDDELIRFTLQEVCEFAGFESEAFENGALALQRFHQGRFEVVLVDYFMPVMDGVETVGALRKLDDQVPIVVLTVDERQETVNRFREAGATDFALKPVRVPDLISRITLNLELSRLKRQQQTKQTEVLVPKGISENTISVIVDYLKNQAEPVTLEMITKNIGLAYPTVQRYMAHLLKEGHVNADFQYGKIGRPIKHYFWNGD